ncbi:tetratricopeptide repeat-containing sulfotransferase family protein [Komagataeibacter swingsii]|uniref:Sulfotransferase n=1 Tax=Komagataeibacter swingsii TaxID=215220 RepID=A0A2V4RJN1_9PROT|nr:tetratricopeptide repeat-containing sulfotransferase family protein [Komagataeibacter swingsii]PYD68905.1 sulfotransferase [Komagataeibacter swingsii]GBQ63800.1 sulfotransferase [Komagataeibacter swingsii DSM 16373]
MGNVRQARYALSRGNPVQARNIAAMIIAREPDRAEAHFLLGLSEVTLGNIRPGAAHMEQAVTLGRSAEFFAQLARCLLLLRRDADAAAALRDAEGCLEAGEKSDPLTRDTIGCAYARLGEHAASVPHFEAAVQGKPRHEQFLYNLAVALSFVGRVKEAEQAFERLLASAPGHARAHHALSRLRRQTAENNHVPRLNAAHGATRTPEDRLLLGYALSKELEDLGDTQASFRALRNANAEHRKNLPYSFDRDAAIFDAIEKNWSLFAQAPVSNPPDAAPVFVMGMPRTGTTLVDRILSSHPDIASAGELQAFPIAVKIASRVRTRMVLDPETVAHTAGRDLGAIGQAYLERAHPHVPKDSPRFSDKFPGNFIYAGLIARALPRARLICLRRHPMDTVLSNFKNLFATTSRYYDYSYCIEDIARYYVRFDRLMRLWQKAIPGRVLEIRYEDIVEDQEGATRRLLAHCGLPWSEECLAFHTNAAPVSTPSAAQVRRPIYRDALARWKRHEVELEPARVIFEQNGISV